MASYFSFNSGRKVTKRTPPPDARASHALSHLRCQRVVLTRHPGSTRLDWPSMANRPYQRNCLRRALGGTCLPLKFAQVFGFGRAQGILILGVRDVGFSPVEPGRRLRTTCWQRRMPRAPEGQTDGGVFIFWLLFFRQAKTNSSGMNLCCEVDLKGDSQGRDFRHQAKSNARTGTLHGSALPVIQPIPIPPVPDSTEWDHSGSARSGDAGV